MMTSSPDPITARIEQFYNDLNRIEAEAKAKRETLSLQFQADMKALLPTPVLVSFNTEWMPPAGSRFVNGSPDAIQSITLEGVRVDYTVDPTHWFRPDGEA